MYLAVMIVGGLLGGLVAHNKSRNLFFWTVCCGVMPLLLLILLALPRLSREGVWRPCPFCLRVIPWEAKVCAACRREVPPPRTEACAYCGATVWAGQDHCPKCGNSAPWKEDNPNP